LKKQEARDKKQGHSGTGGFFLEFFKQPMFLFSHLRKSVTFSVEICGKFLNLEFGAFEKFLE
jgi:hypothetical protein